LIGLLSRQPPLGIALAFKGFGDLGAVRGPITREPRLGPILLVADVPHRFKISIAKQAVDTYDQASGRDGARSWTV
jgi:hypothetical protein